MSDISKAIRTEVEERAEFRCEYCRLPSKGQIAWFPIDHVTPRNKGGKTHLENLALSCPRCNGHKWTFTTAHDPISDTEVALYHPRKDRWDEHFEWDDEEGFTITGKTPKGRATVERLNMNAPETVEIRSLLTQLGMDIT